MNLTDCFVFKSSGSIIVTYPSRLSTTLSSPTTEESTILPSTAPSTSPSTSPSTLPSSFEEVVSTLLTTNKPPAEIPLTTPKESEETREPTEPTEKPSGKEGGTFGARKDESGEGNTAVTVSLAVVGCLLLVAVVLLVLWLKRRSAKALNEKSGAPVNTCGSVDNPMMMSQMENIYAEADVDYPKKGKENVVYDYARGNMETNYTSLDINKVESVPTYESLINTQNDMYEQIPVKDNAKSSTVVGLAAQTPIAEPFYNVVDDNVPDEPDENSKTREIPGRTGHEDSERVYSTLEEDDTPESCGREVAGRTGYDDTERVYSALDDEIVESDYLTILPEKSDYELPINPPVPDA